MPAKALTAIGIFLAGSALAVAAQAPSRDTRPAAVARVNRRAFVA